MGQQEKQGGRIVKRWVAECFVTTWPPEKPGTQRKDCDFNERKKPTLHTNPESALREALSHARMNGHVGARQVQVKRLYTPRTIASEEVIG